MTADSDRLPADAVLLNPASLWAISDFVVHDGRDAPPEFRFNPPTVSRLLARIETVRDGDIVCVKSNLCRAFFAIAFPRLRARIVLLTVEGDWGTPGPHLPQLEDDRIIRWFGQNCDLMGPHPKFAPMPLGIAAPHWPHGDQRALLRVHRDMARAGQKLEAHASFHLTLSHPERSEVWSRLERRAGLAFEPQRLPPEKLWARLADYAFTVSPRGAGLDCHRTWEALALRSIPIVKRSTLDPVFEGFPVVKVDDWGDVTLAAMAEWRAALADKFTADMFQRLTAPHWTALILAAGASATGG